MTAPSSTAVRLDPAKIRRRRHGRWLTIADVAAVVGVHPSVVSRWERGDNPVPAGRVDALAAALNTTVERLTAEATS